LALGTREIPKICGGIETVLVSSWIVSPMVGMEDHIHGDQAFLRMLKSKKDPTQKTCTCEQFRAYGYTVA